VPCPAGPILRVGPEGAHAEGARTCLRTRWLRQAKVIERTSTDAAFRAQLETSPASALAGYDLTADERAAVLTSDSDRTPDIGVDIRVSKLTEPAQPGFGGPQGNNE
jgi:hypothetical protein